MVMTLTVHVGDGELTSYTVRCMPVKINGHFPTICKRIADVTEPGQPFAAYVSVFACSREEALEAAVAKLKDKWLRHRNWETEWTAQDVVG